MVEPHACMPVMIRPRNLVALLLVVLWLPATLHCGFEAMGWLTPAGVDCCAGDDACAQDGCGVIEDGAYKVPSGDIKVRLPNLTGVLYLIDPLPLAQERFAPRETERGRGIGFDDRRFAGWQFEWRCAAEASAPPDCA
jgi:hypothetical protein